MTRKEVAVRNERNRRKMKEYWGQEEYEKLLKRSKKIRYYEKDGKLFFEYLEGRDDSVGDPISWLIAYDLRVDKEIPLSIRQRGRKAIRDYAKKEVGRAKEKEKRLEKFGKNPNVPVSVKYRGVLLEGRIVAANQRWLSVKLEKPERYSGECNINFSFGPGIFEVGDEPKINKEGISGAQEALRRAYDFKKRLEDNKELVDLAKRLNNRK